MKKISAIIFALVMMLAVVGCGNKDDIEKTNSDQYIDAEILEIGEDTILVKPFGGEEMPSDAVTVSTSMYGDDELPELEVGMQVRIMLGGQAKERTVLAIYPLDQINAD